MGLVVTKGEERGRAGGEGGRRELKGIMIGIHDVWGDYGEDSVAQRGQIVTLWHLTTVMDSDCNVVWGRHDNMVNVKKNFTLFFHVKTS